MAIPPCKLTFLEEALLETRFSNIYTHHEPTLLTQGIVGYHSKNFFSILSDTVYLKLTVALMRSFTPSSNEMG